MVWVLLECLRSFWELAVLLPLFPPPISWYGWTAYIVSSRKLGKHVLVVPSDCRGVLQVAHESPCQSHLPGKLRAKSVDTSSGLPWPQTSETTVAPATSANVSHQGGGSSLFPSNPCLRWLSPSLGWR
ncbi:hypothetical protein E2C01_100288 [Portunus trituberculatus]|uniref:Uncharacterized protein n=1 Tax=Portunus trituberculatus TaxID=210409 RepID=A0A5B7K2N1_PORTR|nr:hypothetical protein [Portunus trituberculatus]